MRFPAGWDLHSGGTRRWITNVHDAGRLMRFMGRRDVEDRESSLGQHDVLFPDAVREGNVPMQSGNSRLGEADTSAGKAVREPHVEIERRGNRDGFVVSCI